MIIVMVTEMVRVIVMMIVIISNNDEQVLDASIDVMYDTEYPY